MQKMHAPITGEQLSQIALLEGQQHKLSEQFRYILKITLGLLIFRTIYGPYLSLGIRLYLGIRSLIGEEEV